MNTSEKSFNQAWEKLTTKGEMCPENTFVKFTPTGIRKNVKEEETLYHGTKADLKVGDYLKPGYPSNYGARKIANFVYVTAIKDGAALAAELAVGEGRGRVYIVEPTGQIEDDPNVTDKKFPGNPPVPTGQKSRYVLSGKWMIGSGFQKKHLPKSVSAWKKLLNQALRQLTNHSVFRCSRKRVHASSCSKIEPCISS